jgi:hypothetical protein
MHLHAFRTNGRIGFTDEPSSGRCRTAAMFTVLKHGEMILLHTPASSAATIGR